MVEWSGVVLTLLLWLLLICCYIYKYFPFCPPAGFVLIMIDTFIGGHHSAVTFKL